MHVVTRGLAVLVVALALLAHGRAEAAGKSDAQRYAGTYKYAGGAGEQQRIQEAVAVATKGMVGGDIAKKELMKRAEVRSSYTLKFEGKTSTVSSPGFPPESAPLDGSPVEMTNKYDDKLEVRQHFVDGALVQESKAKDGEGSTRFALQPDGKTLKVTRISKSPKLPKPVEYTLTYRRK